MIKRYNNSPAEAADRYRIVGQDAISRVAFESWVRQNTSPNAKLSEEERGCLRRNKLNPDEPSTVVNVELLDNDALERRALSVSTGSGGGVTVPAGFVRNWELAQDALPIPRLATKDRVPHGGEWPTPTIDDRAGNGVGTILNENATGTTVAATWGRMIAKPYKITSGNIKCPFELSQDATRFAAQFGKVAGLRYARGVNYFGTVGTGVNQPMGLCFSANSVAAANSSTIAGDDLINLMAGIGDGHFDDELNPPRWMLAKSTLAKIWALKDGQGRYLFNFEERKLFGFPVTLNSVMPAIATGNSSLLFGDFSKVLLTEVNSVRIDAFSETFADSDQILWRAIGRADVTLLEAGSNPIARLAHP